MSVCEVCEGMSSVVRVGVCECMSCEGVSCECVSCECVKCEGVRVLQPLVSV